MKLMYGASRKKLRRAINRIREREGTQDKDT